MRGAGSQGAAQTGAFTLWHRSLHSNNSFLAFSQGGLRIKYIGPGTDDRDAASVRARQPVKTELHYFEVEVISKGKLGFIGVGYSQADFDIGRLPGWVPHSYGYHGDDGKAFGDDTHGRPYGPLFGTGDVIGAAFNMAERTITYFKNGFDIGVAFSNVPEEQLFPTVGLRTPDEEVHINFDGPFRTDVSQLRARAAEHMRQRIWDTRLPEDKAGSARMLSSLIVGHLKHCGHFETAAQVARLMQGCAKPASPGEVEDFRARGSISAAVCAGQVDSALEQVQQYAPQALSARPDLLFRLRCQKLVELIRENDALGAISYGRSEVAANDTGDMGQAERARLTDTLSLLAYKNPEVSPHGGLMSSEARAELADALDEAILKASGRLQYSPLEHLLRSLHALSGELRASKNPAAALAGFDGMISLSAAGRQGPAAMEQ